MGYAKKKNICFRVPSDTAGHAVASRMVPIHTTLEMPWLSSRNRSAMSTSTSCPYQCGETRLFLSGLLEPLKKAARMLDNFVVSRNRNWVDTPMTFQDTNWACKRWQGHYQLQTFDKPTFWGRATSHVWCTLCTSPWQKHTKDFPTVFLHAAWQMDVYFATNFRIKLFLKKNSQQIYTWDQKGYKKCGFVKDIAPSKTNPAIQPRFISVGVPKHHNMLIALFPKHLKAENIETHWKKILSKIGDIESSFIYPAAVSIINSIFRTNYDSSPLNFFSWLTPVRYPISIPVPWKLPGLAGFFIRGFADKKCFNNPFWILRPRLHRQGYVRSSPKGSLAFSRKSKARLLPKTHQIDESRQISKSLSRKPLLKITLSFWL